MIVSKTRKIQKFWPALVFILWAMPLGFGLSMGLSQHLVAHEKDDLRGLAMAPDPVVHHFLSEQCSCSKNLIEHLTARRILPSVREVIHLVHPQPTTIERLKRAGFEIDPIAEEAAVKKYNLQSLPQLVVTNDNHIVYQGGYGRDQQHSQVYEDEAIIRDSVANRHVAELPLFGCANGQLRKSSIDILGVKYAAE